MADNDGTLRLAYCFEKSDGTRYVPYDQTTEPVVVLSARSFTGMDDTRFDASVDAMAQDGTLVTMGENDGKGAELQGK